MEVVTDVGQQETSVHVVSDVTAVVDAGDQVAQSLPRSVVVLVQVDTQQVLRYLRQHRYFRC